MEKDRNGQGKAGNPPSTPADPRLSQIGDRLSKAREAATGPERAEARGSQIGYAMRLATELVASILVGAVIGWFLDRWLGTLPLFLLIFFALGTAAGLRNAIRFASASQSRAEDGNQHSGG